MCRLGTVTPGLDRARSSTILYVPLRVPESSRAKGSGGGGGACRFSLQSVDSTETRAGVADSLGAAAPPSACRGGDTPPPPATGSALKAPSEEGRPCSPPSPPPRCSAPLAPLAAPAHAWRASRGGGWQPAGSATSAAACGRWTPLKAPRPSRERRNCMGTRGAVQGGLHLDVWGWMYGAAAWVHGSTGRAAR